MCFTVGLLVTTDTVSYSDCSTGICKGLFGLDVTWTVGNNDGQVGANARHLPPFGAPAFVFVTHGLLILNDQ